MSHDSSRADGAFVAGRARQALVVHSPQPGVPASPTVELPPLEVPPVEPPACAPPAPALVPPPLGPLVPSLPVVLPHEQVRPSSSQTTIPFREVIDRPSAN